jgi:hypothetical protein
MVNPVEADASVDDVQFLSIYIQAHVTPEADHKIIVIDSNGELQESNEGVNVVGLSGYFVVSPAIPAYDYAVIQLDNGVSTDMSGVGQNNKPIKVMKDNQVYIIQGENVYSVTGKIQ